MHCTAVEREDDVLIEKLQVKGERIPEIADAAFPRVFTSATTPDQHSGSRMEYTASLVLPGFYRRSKQKSGLGSNGIRPTEPLGGRLLLRLTNRSDYTNEIVVMAADDLTGKVRNFFIAIPPRQNYTAALESILDCDELYIISWQEFDAAYMYQGLGNSDQFTSLPVQPPGLLRERQRAISAYYRERDSTKRFSGNYLFGYFEQAVRGDDGYDMSLHIFWPHHGELLHISYGCGEHNAGLGNTEHERFLSVTGSGFPSLLPSTETEMTIFVVSDMATGAFFQPKLGGSPQ